MQVFLVMSVLSVNQGDHSHLLAQAFPFFQVDSLSWKSVEKPENIQVTQASEKQTL